MRIAEIVTAVILGIFSIYLMWKSGEPPSWNPDIPRFANIGMIEGEGPGSGFWPFWLHSSCWSVASGLGLTGTAECHHSQILPNHFWMVMGVV